MATASSATLITVAPTGAAFCAGCGVTDAEGTLVYGRYLTHQLRKVTLDGARTGVLADRLLFQNDDAVLAVERDPRDGSLWFSDFGHVKRLHS